MEDPGFKIGVIYINAEEFKYAVRSYHRKWGKNIWFLKIDKQRVTGVCKEE